LGSTGMTGGERTRWRLGVSAPIPGQPKRTRTYLLSGTGYIQVYTLPTIILSINSGEVQVALWPLPAK